MGHRTFSGTDDQTYSVNHVHNTFDFSSEILMARSVNNVDAIVAIVDASAFGSESANLYKMVMPF